MNLAALAGLDFDPLDMDVDEQRRRRGLTTATGQPQPPELAGVRTDPRRPNSQQPMAGEMVRGKEVGGDNAAWPPPPQRPGAVAPVAAPARPMTGVVRRLPLPVAAGVQGAPAAGTTMPPRPSIPFGAPTGATSPVALTALPPLQATAPAAGLAALPHYAQGGAIPPGAAGVVGDATGNPDDEEVVHALPGGGASVAPVTPPTTLPSQIAGLPDDAPTRAQMLAGFGPMSYGRPPQETTATDRYQKALGEFEPGGPLSADNAPRPDQYKAHGWRRVLGDIAGVAAGALSFSPGAGMLVHDAITGAPYRRAAENYDQQRRYALAALPEMQQAAKMEGDQNDRQQSQYDADRTFNEQQWRDQQDSANAQARIQADRDKVAAMYPPMQPGTPPPDMKTPQERSGYADQHPELFHGFTQREREAWILDGRLPARAAEPQAAGTNTPATPKGQLTDAQRALTETRMRTTAQHDLARLDEEKNRAYANQEKAFQARINDWLKRNRDASQDEIRQMRQQMDTWNNEQKGIIQTTYEQGRQHLFDTLGENMDQLGGGSAAPVPATAQARALQHAAPSGGTLDPAIAARLAVGKYAHMTDGSVWTKNPDGSVTRVR